MADEGKCAEDRHRSRLTAVLKFLQEQEARSDTHMGMWDSVRWELVAQYGYTRYLEGVIDGMKAREG